jgi:hypothetical protein
MLSTEPSSVGIQNYSIQQVQEQKFPSILAQLLQSVEFVTCIAPRATARAHTTLLHHPCPYHDYGFAAPTSF